MFWQQFEEGFSCFNATKRPATEKGVIKDGEDEPERCLSDLKPIDSLVMASPFRNFSDAPIASGIFCESLKPTTPQSSPRWTLSVPMSTAEKTRV